MKRYERDMERECVRVCAAPPVLLFPTPMFPQGLPCGSLDVFVLRMSVYVVYAQLEKHVHDLLYAGKLAICARHA